MSYKTHFPATGISSLKRHDSAYNAMRRYGEHAVLTMLAVFSGGQLRLHLGEQQGGHVASTPAAHDPPHSRSCAMISRRPHTMISRACNSRVSLYVVYKRKRCPWNHMLLEMTRMATGVLAFVGNILRQRTKSIPVLYLAGTAAECPAEANEAQMVELAPLGGLHVHG